MNIKTCWNGSILIREFYIEDDTLVYTGRDAVMPVADSIDWVDWVETWADGHIPAWQNIECFNIDSTNYVVNR